MSLIPFFVWAGIFSARNCLEGLSPSGSDSHWRQISFSASVQVPVRFFSDLTLYLFAAPFTNIERECYRL